VKKEPVQIEGLEAHIKRLRELPVELASSRGGPIRKALRKTVKENLEQPLKARMQIPKDSGQLEKAVKVKIVEAKKRDRANARASNYEAFNLGVVDGYVQNNATGKQEPISYRAYVSEYGGEVPEGDMMNGSSGYRPAAKWFRRGLRADQQRALTAFMSNMTIAIDAAIRKLSKRYGK